MRWGLGASVVLLVAGLGCQVPAAAAPAALATGEASRPSSPAFQDEPQAGPATDSPAEEAALLDRARAQRRERPVDALLLTQLHALRVTPPRCRATS